MRTYDGFRDALVKNFQNLQDAWAIKRGGSFKATLLIVFNRILTWNLAVDAQDLALDLVKYLSSDNKPIVHSSVNINLTLKCLICQMKSQISLAMGIQNKCLLLKGREKIFRYSKCLCKYLLSCNTQSQNIPLCKFLNFKKS